jgi:hypothetical protein
MLTLKAVILVVLTFVKTHSAEEFDSVYAINFAGSTHVDSDGVKFEPFTGNCSTHSSNTKYADVPEKDYTLYQQYCSGQKLIYNIPLSGSGKYLLNPKFSLNSNTMKLVLNRKHETVIESGKYLKEQSAYDEYIVFSVCDNRLQFKNESSIISNNTIDFEVLNNCVDCDLEISISALVLFKGNDIHTFEIRPVAKNFNADDLVQQAKYECRESRTTP